MHPALMYLLGIGAFVMVVGLVITVVALRNAPEGFEDDDGFVGVTKGDELLLKQYSEQAHFGHVHGSADLAA